MGAGPAGSATACLLAELGHSVALLDRARFPRPKPCAEYLSPEAGRVLQRLGVFEALRAAGGAELSGMRVVTGDGISFTGRFAGAGAERFPRFSDTGLALRREILDAALLDAARRRGVTVIEDAAARDLERTARGVAVVARTSQGPLRVSARTVVGADGLNSRVAAVLGLKRWRGRQRIAFVTHARGVDGMSDVGEIHVGTRGYAGLAPVGDGVTNVALVVDAGLAGHGFHALLDRFPEVRLRTARATPVSPIRAVGPFGRWSPRATAERALLVGDAADFHDPVTGEGVYAALRGAELAAARLHDGLNGDRLGARDLRGYDRDRRRVFGGKWLVERLIGWAIATPAVLSLAARRLRDRPQLADLLVGVTGDFIPPRELFRPAVLARLAW